jgi:hypothetical protein
MYWAKKAADQGFSPSQNRIGILYRFGWGVDIDQAKALEWFHKAAEQNDPEACFNIGNMFDMGEGVSIDYSEAAKWYRKAAGIEMPNAQDALGAWEAWTVDEGFDISCQRWVIAADLSGLTNQEKI